MTSTPISPGRRRFIKLGLSSLAAAAVAAPDLSVFAEDLEAFVKGPPVPDIAPRQLSPHVWMIHARDGFPTPENRGMMSNVTFAIAREGVIVFDSGGSVQIGEMALRQIRRLTDKPVLAVFVSHYHGDHWLGNHAFVDAFGPELPIFAHPSTKREIEGIQGNLWKTLMEQWTNQSTAGTRVVPPNRELAHGDRFDFGDLTLRVHHYGTAHTPGDVCVEIVEDGLTCVGDVAMDRRIANMDEGSYTGTFAFFDALEKHAASRIWVPGHGNAGPDVLRWNRALFAGIYENCVSAVEAGADIGEAKRRVLQDPRVSSRARETAGFDSNIGKYVSLAYLEAEKALF